MPLLCAIAIVRPEMKVIRGDSSVLLPGSSLHSARASKNYNLILFRTILHPPDSFVSKNEGMAEGLARLRRGAQQQNPGDPAPLLRLARRKLSAAQNPDLHAAAPVDSTQGIDLASLAYQPQHRRGHVDNAEEALTTCPQPQQQQQTADQNPLKSPTRLRDEAFRAVRPSACRCRSHASGHEKIRSL